eukprot:2846001-Pleurochrysis_carterae.AAC.1
MMSANYPVDVLHTGPLIRTWCMTFEAMFQLLKGFAANSNYKDVIKRMASVWSVRTGLELVDEKLVHWSESWATRQDDDIILHYLADRTVQFGGRDSSSLDAAFTCK